MKITHFRPLVPDAAPRGRLQRVAWFEIYFWKTRLRFHCPPSTATHPYPADERPFVNTESRRGYTEEDGEVFVHTTVYTAAWKLGRRSLFARRKAKLLLRLWGLSISRDAEKMYPTLYDPYIAHDWLIKTYRRKHASMGQLGFLPPRNGFSEIAFTDNDTARRIAETKTYTINNLEINRHLVYECSPFNNHLDYFIPVSKHDFAHFEFCIRADEDIAEQKEQLLKEAQQRVNTIISSLRIDKAAQDIPPVCPAPDSSHCS